MSRTQRENISKHRVTCALVSLTLLERMSQLIINTSTSGWPFWWWTLRIRQLRWFGLQWGWKLPMARWLVGGSGHTLSQEDRKKEMLGPIALFNSTFHWSEDYLLGSPVRGPQHFPVLPPQGPHLYIWTFQGHDNSKPQPWERPMALAMFIRRWPWIEMLWQIYQNQVTFQEAKHRKLNAG